MESCNLFSNSKVRNNDLIMITILKADAVLFPIRILRCQIRNFKMFKIGQDFLELFQGFRIENQNVVIIKLRFRQLPILREFQMPVFTSFAKEYTVIAIMVFKLPNHFKLQNRSVKVDQLPEILVMLAYREII